MEISTTEPSPEVVAPATVPQTRLNMFKNFITGPNKKKVDEITYWINNKNYKGDIRLNDAPEQTDTVDPINPSGEIKLLQDTPKNNDALNDIKYPEYEIIYAAMAAAARPLDFPDSSIIDPTYNEREVAAIIAAEMALVPIISAEIDLQKNMLRRLQGFFNTVGKTFNNLFYFDKEKLSKMAKIGLIPFGIILILVAGGLLIAKNLGLKLGKVRYFAIQKASNCRGIIPLNFLKIIYYKYGSGKINDNEIVKIFEKYSNEIYAVVAAEIKFLQLSQNFVEVLPISPHENIERAIVYAAMTAKQSILRVIQEPHIYDPKEVAAIISAERAFVNIPFIAKEPLYKRVKELLDKTFGNFKPSEWLKKISFPTLKSFSKKQIVHLFNKGRISLGHILLLLASGLCKGVVGLLGLGLGAGIAGIGIGIAGIAGIGFGIKQAVLYAMDVASRCYGLVPTYILDKLNDMLTQNKLTVGNTFNMLQSCANEWPAVIAAEMNFLKNGISSNPMINSGLIGKTTTTTTPTSTTTSLSGVKQILKSPSSPRSVDSDVYEQENSQARITDITKTLNLDGETYTTTQNVTTVAVGDG